MCEGEYESLKAIYAISPSFVPRPYAWGAIEENGFTAHFLLTAFRGIEKQVWVLRSQGCPNADANSLQIRSDWLKD